MNGLVSASAGAFLIERPSANKIVAFDLVNGTAKSLVDVQYVYSTAQDWVTIKGADVESLKATASQEYWVSRSVSLFHSALNDLSEALTKRVFEELAEILDTHAISELVLSRLLVAPLKQTSNLQNLSSLALANGCVLVASLLDELRELQPLIQSFSDRWLGLPSSIFETLSEPKKYFWSTIVESGKMQDIISCKSASDFTNKLGLITFNLDTIVLRSNFISISKEFSKYLFPYVTNEKRIEDIVIWHDDSNDYIEKEAISRLDKFDRAQIQIDAIYQSISQGHDANATRYIKDLIKSQSNDKKYLIKSLCSIATQSSELFRPDFEGYCLQEALKVSPDDAWTLTQYGNHLKKVGHYPEALVAFNRAGELGQAVFAKSSEADVYTQQGDYLKAIETYKSITDWENMPAVVTGIADNLRKHGQFPEAEAIYEIIIKKGTEGQFGFVEAIQRAQAGTAEIAKRQGDFKKATTIYKNLVSKGGVNSKLSLYWKLGLGYVLKFQGKYHDAYTLIDEIVQTYPFAIEAKFLRGSILGLIGREVDGLKDLSEGKDAHAWRGWLRSFYSGLILLKLDRFSEARAELVDKLSNAIASGEELSYLRMAAALCFLKEGEVGLAEEKLSDLPDLHDGRSKFLSLVMQLHCASKKNDSAQIKQIKLSLSGLKIVDVGLKNAVRAIDHRDYDRSLSLITESLLAA